MKTVFVVVIKNIDDEISTNGVFETLPDAHQKATTLARKMFNDYCFDYERDLNFAEEVEFSDHCGQIIITMDDVFEITIHRDYMDLV